MVIITNAVVTVGLWVRHGGMHTLGAPGGALTAVGQVAGLVGTYAVLLQLLLMSRIGWLERHIGFDRLAVLHRWNGFASVALLSTHAVAITLGYAAADRLSVAAQLGDFVRHYPYVLMSVVGFALFLGIGVTSVRSMRRRVRRETWYALHLYAYLAVALSFAHQLAVGNDFVTDPLARAWWVTLYVAVAAAILWWRVGYPLVFNARHRLRVHSVRDEADAVVSVYLAGRHLERINADGGQFFLWRFGPGTRWAKAHPYSLSAAPNAKYLRITVKALGDDSARVRQLRPGSALYQELDEPAPSCRTRITAIYSDLDQVVVPTNSGRCEHPDLGARNVLVHGVGHTTLPVHRGVVDEVAATLAGRREASLVAAPSTPATTAVA